MDQLHYSDLKLRHYFTDSKLTIAQKQLMFRCRVRMEKFGENFRGDASQLLCRLCHEHADNLEMAFQCQEIRKKLNVVGDPQDIYTEHGYNETIHTISEIMKIREQASN